MLLIYNRNTLKILICNMIYKVLKTNIFLYIKQELTKKNVGKMAGKINTCTK